MPVSAVLSFDNAKSKMTKVCLRQIRLSGHYTTIFSQVAVVAILCKQRKI
jgi:hypothetical protein